ncbi:hypothetical protein G5V57_20205 [Nordella sp. HKS 07]|uniref:hypothetical protein n=1 Tax=Nordella sp. HKS 07 TaxID=2712222 RepID=UPI0013E1A882|nr:hypothetical protein [Nordella sp. HKS 07]QIG49837.1 hypothetical protein G5V57_20205 [Nordella sp. HKS 07]
MHSFQVELLHGLGGADRMDRLAELREPTGEDQALLAEMDRALPARSTSALIANLLLRLGNARPTPDQLAKLTLGDRERLLLAVCSHLLGAQADLAVTCPACRALVEVPIRFSDLISARPARAAIRCSLVAGDGEWSAELTPPTGMDLDRAMKAGSEAARRLLESGLMALFDARGQAVSRDALPQECEAELAEKLLALDPLAECRIGVECPHCTQHFDTLLDGFALLRTAFGGAEALYGDVYRMARAYHWSEADILALPLAKRARYLAIAMAAEADT